MARSTRAAESTARRADGRSRLLDTAERLYAERGIDGVSLREITEAAGQRNASVVQYYFGSRAGLVAAIVERHMAVVDAARTVRLDDATSAARQPTVHEVTQILVEPLAERLRTPSGRCYLRVVQHLVDLPPDDGAAPTALSRSNRSLTRATALLAGFTRDLPRSVRAERQAQTTSFLLRALADRASLIDAGGPVRKRTSHELFVANLIDVLVAVLTTEPSPTTTALAT